MPAVAAGFAGRMMLLMHVSRTWLLMTGAYAFLIAALTWSWAGDPGGFKPAEAATLLLLLPTALVTLPTSYVVLAAIWNVTGSSVSQGNVPTGITVAYTVWFALLAVINALAVTAGYRALRLRRITPHHAVALPPQ